ncbi:hypothetical protein OWV82_006834 [Melia azedarach]|uniref:Uncharacterized protein n=1 Tax=Melia azedarach TaxID=155640 RepID=A0ACC1YK93_MELAZ|nr:hypothetical protein OWV82_006834 [Melia azedarach]
MLVGSVQQRAFPHQPTKTPVKKIREVKKNKKNKKLKGREALSICGQKFFVPGVQASHLIQDGSQLAMEAREVLDNGGSVVVEKVALSSQERKT